MELRIYQGDITQLAVDAVVNAANNHLLGGGGVDGAIHRAAGEQLLESCRQLSGCATGAAKMTLGFNLPAKYIFHTVGPVWRGGAYDEAKLLANCYHGCFALAAEHHIETMAFPAISCGVYAYPLAAALEVIKRVIAAYSQHPSLTKTIFCVYSHTHYLQYQSAFPEAILADEVIS